MMIMMKSSLQKSAPQPHEGWSGIFNATENTTRCPQMDLLRKKTISGNEDCLHINVHIPEDPHMIKIPKPVMVFVHGGAFSWGYGDIYKADYLINYDIIFVTFNYRLNVFGFLNLDLPECPGNVGLKDQMMAFSWVRENIAAFGGDPTNVTAFGESAGAASIHYLMLCSASHGLFDKAILQSGSAICSWAFTKNKEKNAFHLGKILGCDTTDKQKLLNFLLKVPAENLVQAQSTVLRESAGNDVLRLAFVPSVEERSCPDILLCDDPINLLNNIVKIPVITGLTDLEGLIIIFGKPIPQIAWLNDDFNVLPNDIHPFRHRFPQIEKKVKEFYFGDKPICEETFPQIVDLFSDVAFSSNFYDVTKPLLENGSKPPVFFYKFSYESSYNLLKQVVMVEFPFISDLEGPCHGDELFYLFIVEMGINITFEGEEKMVDLMCTWWTNFAKSGSPTSPSSPWTPSTYHNPCYMSIGDQQEMKQGLINEHRINFWNSLKREVELLNNSTDSKL